jgi:hypothetical protein
VVLVAIASVGLLLKVPHDVGWYVIDVTADSALMNPPLVLLNCHLTRYVLPALPVLTTFGLFIWARKPLKA